MDEFKELKYYQNFLEEKEKHDSLKNGIIFCAVIIIGAIPALITFWIIVRCLMTKRQITKD